MKYYITLLFLLLGLPLAAKSDKPISKCAVAFWVSPNGNDNNPGTRELPFQTLQKARDAVRTVPSSAFNYDVYVYLRGGTYRMQQPLVLDPIDSGKNGHDVVYTAATGEIPVISGAIPVTNWSLHDPTLNIWQAYVGPSYNSRQLYVNGVRAERARTTLYPIAFLPAYIFGGTLFIPTDMNPAQWRDPTTWTNPQNVEAVILTQWKMMRVPVSSVVPYNPPLPGVLVMQEPAWTNANIYLDAVTNLPGIWSMWQITWLENTYEFLTEPGQWYLNNTTGYIYYIPRPGENLSTANVELPILENLIIGNGSPSQPLEHIFFKGLTFSYATWLGPSGPDGYVADQSGFLLLGSGHQPNITGHDRFVTATPGNLSFIYSQNIYFFGNIFEHLGAVALQFDKGCSNNTVDSNIFEDISSSSVELGGAAPEYAHPASPGDILQNNVITNNIIHDVAVDYQDAAGIMVGFSRETTISHNSIKNVPWSGIAMGWGWGLLDPGGYPGLPHAYTNEWGVVTSLTPNYKCKILNNKIEKYAEVLWDAGAVYTTGRQGPSVTTGLLIKENVAFNKRKDGGTNTFYTDGGSRFIRLERNASYNNPIGIAYLGPPPPPGDPLPYNPIPSLGNGTPYGSDFGGCRTYGDIRYVENYWLQNPMLEQQALYNSLYEPLLGFNMYSPEGFFDICPVEIDGISYPKNLSYKNNHVINSRYDIPKDILKNAGVQKRPSTIPKERWKL